VLQRGELGLHLRGHDAKVEAADDIGNQVGSGAGSAQEVPHLGLPVRAQGHHRNDPEHVERQIADDELNGIRQLHQHEIAAPQAESGEAGGAIRGARKQRSVGQPVFPLHQRELVRPAGRTAREHVADGHALPQPARAVACRDVLRPADEAFHGCPLL